MREETIQEAIDTLYNGNISTFKVWLKKASKIDVLKATMLCNGKDQNDTASLVERMVWYLEQNK